MINVKRIYEKPSSGDGARVLVDRLWPRGVSKAQAQLTLWMKEIGPSTELRKWFNHDPNKWKDFKRNYNLELKEHADLLQQLKKLSKKHKKVTLLYGAKDEKHNEAVIIKEMLSR